MHQFYRSSFVAPDSDNDDDVKVAQDFKLFYDSDEDAWNNTSTTEKIEEIDIKLEEIPKVETDENLDSKRKKLTVRGLSGLKNIGNTCYMNSILQCLGSLVVFNSWLRKEKFKKRLENNKMFELAEMKRKKDNLDEDINLILPKEEIHDAMENTIVYRLSELYDYMWKQNCTITPKSFKKIIGEKNTAFKGFDQNDSQELLNLILDKIHDEIKAEVTIQFCNFPQSVIDIIKVREECARVINDKSTSIEQKEAASKYYKEFRLKHPDDVTILMASTFWKKHIKKNHSIITDLFTGLYYSKIECMECSNCTSNFEPFIMMSIPTKEEGETTLEECLLDFTKEETLDGDNKYNCDVCMKKVSAKKRMYIWEPPEILIIHPHYNYKF